MKTHALSMMVLIYLVMMVGCSEDPPSTTPNKDNNEPGEMGQAGGDMDPDLDRDSAPDTDSRPDTDMTTTGPDEVGRLAIQPVSGAGMVKGAKFRAHIQVGRVIDVAPGK